MPTSGNARSAADRSVSPARTPSPPLYVGIAESRAISMEKYATMVFDAETFITPLGSQKRQPLIFSCQTGCAFRLAHEHGYRERTQQIRRRQRGLPGEDHSGDREAPGTTPKLLR